MRNSIQKYNANLFTLLLSSGPRKRLARCPGNKVNSRTSCAVKRMYGKPNPFVQTDSACSCFCILYYPSYRKPSIYEIDSLPSKLPPIKQPLPVTALPMLGYLEQTVATAITNALSAVGTVKPKFPFLSSTSTALLFVAYHLKGKRK